jgi:hypothetical protein
MLVGMRGWIRWEMSVLLAVCACTGRGLVDAEDGDDGDDGGPTSAATLDSVGPDGGQEDDDGNELDDGASGSGDGADVTDDGAVQQDVEWLLAVSLFLSPSTPLQWHVLVDWEDGDVVEVRLTSLSLDVGSTTTPRELVGEPTVANELFVDDVGQFAMRFDTLIVPAEANPITGSEIVASDVRFTGMGMPGELNCGLVTGTAVSPIETPLDGSTFGVVQITSVDDLPLEFPTACQ